MVNRRAQPEQGQPAKFLTAGDLAILEIVCEQISVEITDVEDDPTYLRGKGESRELQITYRISDGHSRSGELGVTTLVEDKPPASAVRNPIQTSMVWVGLRTAKGDTCLNL